MSSDTRFVDEFDKILLAQSWRSISPSALVDQWRDFVEACKDGYTATIYEYENERGVRDLLDVVMHHPSLSGFAELTHLSSSIADIDEQFRLVCRRDVMMGDATEPWWRRCVPQRTAGEMADDLMARYGIGTASSGPEAEDEA